MESQPNRKRVAPGSEPPGSGTSGSSGGSSFHPAGEEGGLEQEGDADVEQLRGEVGDLAESTDVNQLRDDLQPSSEAEDAELC